MFKAIIYISEATETFTPEGVGQSGKVWVAGESWHATAPMTPNNELINRGQKVRVNEVRDLVLVVQTES